MLRRSIKSKIIVPMVIMLILLVSTLTIYSVVNFSKITRALLDERITASASALKNYLSECEQRARVAAISLSEDADVIRALQDRDRLGLIRALSPTFDLYKVDYYTVTDEKGVVLVRTHYPNSFGDSIADQQTVKDALGGKVSTRFEESVGVKVGTRTSAPIYDSNGKLIGLIIAGVRFDTDEAVDSFKEHFGAETTVYSGDRRVATTIIKDGERITGTQLSPEVHQVVIEEKREYYGPTDILGEDYSTFYMPLIDANNKAFAVISIGLSNESLIQERNAIIVRAALIGLGGLIVSVVILLLVAARITKPVNQLSYLVSEVSRGNIDIEVDKTLVPNDEIGDLILDTHRLIDIIKSMVGDLSQLTKELSVYHDIEFNLDTSKYSGSYKEIIESVEVLVHNISIMHKTMAVVDYLDTMITVIDLDYKLLYANRAVIEAFDMDRDSCIGKKCFRVIRGLDEPCPICQLPRLLPGLPSGLSSGLSSDLPSGQQPDLPSDLPSGQPSALSSDCSSAFPSDLPSGQQPDLPLEKDSYPSLDFEYLWDDCLNTWIGGKSSIIQWVDGGMVLLTSINDESMRMKQQEQLQEAMSAAQAANQAKSQFLANMSHEIRTPMNAVLGMLELLLAEKLDDRQHSHVEDMKQSALWLLDIINDILDVSKIHADMLTLMLGHYDFSVLIDNVNSMAQSLVRNKEITFELIVDEQMPKYLYGDKVRVKQVLMNLIGNAVKFTEEGEVRLTVNTTDTHIHFAVIDTGIGIAEEDLPTLFDAFVQADITQNRIERGTGLGLTITRSIVEIMGGHIAVESVLGKGSTFTVEIPKVPGDEALVPRLDLSSTNFCAPNAEILVVDDIQTNLSVISGLLELYQISTDAATSGRQAIEMAQQKRYDMVLMDYRMPEMDGIETTRRIRELGITTPIIALTASAAVGAREKMISGGMDDYLSKPIITIELAQMLRKWLPAEKLQELPAEKKYK